MFPRRVNAKVVRAETPKKSDRRRKIYRTRMRGTGVKEESGSETIERGTRRVGPPRVFLFSLLVLDSALSSSSSRSTNMRRNVSSALRRYTPWKLLRSISHF